MLQDFTQEIIEKRRKMMPKFKEAREKGLKARLHMRFLSQQLDAIFVALKLQLQNRMCKPGAIFSAICRSDIAGVSNMFETYPILARQKLHRVAATKIACVNGP